MFGEEDHLRNSGAELHSLIDWGAPSPIAWKIDRTRFSNLERRLLQIPQKRDYPGRMFFHFVNPFSNDFRRGMQPDSDKAEDYKIKEYLKTEPNYETCTWGRKNPCHSDIISCLKEDDVVFGIARVRYGNHEFLKKPSRDRPEHFLTWVLSVDRRIIRKRGNKRWNAFLFNKDSSFLCIPPRIMITREILEELSDKARERENDHFSKFLMEWKKERRKRNPVPYYSTFASAFAQYFHKGPRLNMEQTKSLVKTIKFSYGI